MCTSLADEPTCTVTGVPSLGKFESDAKNQSSVWVAGCVSSSEKTVKRSVSESCAQMASRVCSPLLSLGSVKRVLVFTSSHLPRSMR